jgi:hypothetical protein
MRTALAWAALVALAVVGSAGVRWHQRPWSEAAALRDRVLAAVKDAAATSQCSAAEIDVTELPDAVAGAYVFRNGFRDAVKDLLPSLQPSEARPTGALSRCRFRWTDQGLVQRQSGA